MFRLLGGAQGWDMAAQEYPLRFATRFALDSEVIYMPTTWTWRFV